MPRNAGSTGSAPALQIIGAFLISRMPRNAGSSGSAPALRIIGAFYISIPTFQFSGEFRAAILSALCYLSHLDRLHFITHFNHITCFLILSLQTFLQLKCHDSPFATHPIAMTTAVVSSAVYFFAFIAALRLPQRLAFLAHHLLVSSGCIAIAALASVALPDAAAPFVFAIFGLLSAAEFILFVLRRPLDLLVEAELWIRRFFITVSGYYYGHRARGLPI